MPTDRFLDSLPDPPGHVGGWAVEFRGRFVGDNGVILFNFRVDDSDHLCIEIVGRVVALNALRHCATSFLYGLAAACSADSISTGLYRVVMLSPMRGWGGELRGRCGVESMAGSRVPFRCRPG